MSIFDDDSDSESKPKHHIVGKVSDHQPRTFEEWQVMRRKSPSLFYSAKMQNQMYADAAALGKDQFFTRTKGDWWQKEGSKK